MVSGQTRSLDLQAALKEELGPDIAQQGSAVDFERLRFDFNLPRGMTQTEIAAVEARVNGWIEVRFEVTQTMKVRIKNVSRDATKLFRST